MSQKSICSPRKTWLRRDFGPLLFIETLFVLGCCMAAQSFCFLYRISVGLRFGDSTNIIRVMVEGRTFLSKILWYTAIGWPFNVLKLSSTLSRTRAPEHNASTSMFDCGDDVLSFILSSSSSRYSWCQKKSLTVVSSDHSAVSHAFFASFRRSQACACVFLSRGTLQTLQDFSPLWRSVLLIVFFWWLWSNHLHTINKLLLCSFTSWDKILHGASDWGWLMMFLYFFQQLPPSHQASWWWSCSPFHPRVPV